MNILRLVLNSILNGLFKEIDKIEGKKLLK